MNRYESGRIYKIVDNAYTKCYVGSTCETLTKRFQRHRENYKAYLDGKRNKNASSVILFDEFGVENCKIELIENYPCNNKEELHRREGHYIQSVDCVNKIVAGRTAKEYREDNKDKIHEYNQEYFKNNRDKIIQQCKEYRDNNKEKEQLRHQQKYQRRKEIMNARRKEKMQCPVCFCQISRRCMNKHKQKKHNQEPANNKEENLEIFSELN